MANGTFDIAQTDAQLQAILNKIQPLVTTGSTAPLGFGYGVCETAGATAAKTVSMQNTVLTPGGIIAVNFVNAFTASSPTLSVNGSAAKPIKIYGNAMPMGRQQPPPALLTSPCPAACCGASTTWAPALLTRTACTSVGAT